LAIAEGEQRYDPGMAWEEMKQVVSSSNNPAPADGQPQITLERVGRVAVITLNRPGMRNPLSLDFKRQIFPLLEEVEEDSELSAIVLTGAGKTFCAGAELGEVVHPDGKDGEEQFRSVRTYNQVIQRLRAHDLPVIGAINGAAVGGGAALALACDIAIASEKASYFFAFGRVGAAAADMGCTYLLAKAVGSARARHWILTGRSVSAAEGLAAGLFAEVVPADMLLARAIEIGEEIGKASPRRAAAATKLALNRADDTSFEACITYEAYVQNYMFTTDEHRARLRALMHDGPGATRA